MQHFSTDKRGFTIIESLVAISILVTIIISATAAVQRALMSYNFSKDQITAFYLAQEGFEQVRNIRDENLINGRNWLTGLAADSSDPCWFGGTCTVDPPVTDEAIACNPSTCPVLRQDPTDGWYGYTGSWPATRFTRQITFSSVNSDEVSVSVHVSWNQGGVARQFEAQENLLNWH